MEFFVHGLRVLIISSVLGVVDIIIIAIGTRKLQSSFLSLWHPKEVGVELF